MGENKIKYISFFIDTRKGLNRAKRKLIEAGAMVAGYPDYESRSGLEVTFAVPPTLVTQVEAVAKQQNISYRFV